VKRQLFAITAILIGMSSAWTATGDDKLPKEIAPGVVGDGVHDDTVGLQALLDSGKTNVQMPAPPVCLLISKTLKIHSGQTVAFDRHAVIRLADGSDQIMVTNANHDQGNENVSLLGGIWDMNNLHQSLTEYQKERKYRQLPYDPHRYLGVLMRFNRVKNLCIRGLTLKDPVTYGMELGNLRQFTIEDITFDYNMKRQNMDGVHVHGNSRWGRVANLKGTTNDDLVAFNADDPGYFEMSRGPIEDVSVDGIFAENGWTAVRLLSAGSPIRRIQLANIFGTYRYNIVSFTNHRSHPGSASTFEDISIRGVFCSKSGTNVKFDPLQPGWPGHALIWIATPAVVKNLTISDFHRTESVWPSENINIAEGVTVESLQLNNVSLVNRTAAPMDLLTNRGTIECLSMVNVYVGAEGGKPRGVVLRNLGAIHQQSTGQPLTVNVLPDAAK
jgi:hypothetical protein